MPELPEVETVRRSLEPLLVGARISHVELRRDDIVAGDRSAAALLEGASVASIARRGKQLALIAGAEGRRPGRVLVVHLGMTGQLVHHPSARDLSASTHVHALWSFDGGGVLSFRDPRRFGGLWTLADATELRARWSLLGPDGLDVTGAMLRERAGESGRAVKAALLDQGVVAGIGNIYADESLHRAGIRPTRLCRRIRGAEWESLAASIVGVLGSAIRAGGSTVRDYVGGTGRPGAAQRAHAVYGRGGEPCLTCGRPLRSMSLAQRTTVWCHSCQR